MGLVPREYVVFQYDGDTEVYTQIGITTAKTQDEAVENLAQEEGDFGAVPRSALALIPVKSRLSVIRDADGYFRLTA